MALRARGTDESAHSPVVVVDDEYDVAESTALMLQQRGLDAIIETDPRVVSETLGEEVKCVVSDYKMPHLDGLELLDAVRSDRPNLPFILFTGRGSEEIASEAIEAGVDNYLQKGHQEQYDRLASQVDAAIEKFETEQELTKRRRQFETVFENAFDGIFILDMDAGVIVDANPRACELLDYPYEDLIGTDIARIHPDDYETYMEVGRDLIDSDSCRRVESVCYTRDDEIIPSDITAAPMEYEGKTFLLTIMRPRRSEPS